MKSLLYIFGILFCLFVVTGCTFHPKGEQQERDLAAHEGERYVPRPEDRVLPRLSMNPTPDELVRYAALASPQLEQRFWEWKSAIEQIPQDGTQATNLVLYANTPITNGSTAFNRTVVTVANDPMADIQWPTKPTTAAQRALEEARAAGFRFQQAKLDLRQKLLNAYDEYALAAELLRLEEINAQLLNTTATVAEAGIASGKSTQSAALSTRNELELSQNQIGEFKSRLPGLRAALNAAIGRDPSAELSPPPSLPALPATYDAKRLLQLIAASPAIAALDAEERAKNNGIKLAKLQYVPDFSLSADTDLGGVVQNLMGMVTVPVLRYQAINAAIAQAEANLRATEAMRRQTELDLRSKVISDVAEFEDFRRQITLFENTVIPRAGSIVNLNHSEYETGRTSLTELLESQRSVAAMKGLDANLRIMAAERLLNIESVVGRPLN